MIKSELVLKIAEQNPHLYQRDVEKIVNAILDTIADALARGDRVELRGFGAFSVKKRDARTGRNPRTGESVSISEKVVPGLQDGQGNAAAAQRSGSEGRSKAAARPVIRREVSVIRFLKALILLPVAILIVLLAVANRAPVTLSLDPFSQDAPEFAIAAAPLRGDLRRRHARRGDRRHGNLARAGQEPQVPPRSSGARRDSCAMRPSA